MLLAGRKVPDPTGLLPWDCLFQGPGAGPPVLVAAFGACVPHSDGHDKDVPEAAGGPEPQALLVSRGDRLSGYSRIQAPA